MQKIPGKMIACTWQSTKTVIEAHRPDSRIKNDMVNKGIRSCTREAFIALGYAFCSLSLHSYLFNASTEFPSSVKILALIVGSVFYLRLILFLGIGAMLVKNGNASLRKIEHPHYFMKYFNPSILLYFWLECQCDPKKIPDKYFPLFLNYLNGKKVVSEELNTWLERQDPYTKPPMYTSDDISEFADVIHNRNFLLAIHIDREIDNQSLLWMINLLCQKNLILRQKNLRIPSLEDSLTPLADHIQTIYEAFSHPPHKNELSVVHSILAKLNRKPELANDLKFAPRLQKYKSVINYLADRLQSELLETARQICKKDTSKLPIGVVHFIQPPMVGFFGKKVIPFFFGEPSNHVNLGVQDKVAGLHKLPYIRKVRRSYFPFHGRYLVRLNSSFVPIHLREEVDKIFYSKLKSLALDKDFWKPLKHPTTELTQGNITFKDLSWRVIQFLAAMSYFHRSPVRYWDPDSLDLKKYRHKEMLCSQFIYVLIHTSIKEVNRFLEDQGYPPHPYPADGKEVLMGVTAWRIKYLLEKADMLQLLV